MGHQEYGVNDRLRSVGAESEALSHSPLRPLHADTLASALPNILMWAHWYGLAIMRYALSSNQLARLQY